MSGIVYAPEAENDLVGIADYIARDKPVAARRFATSRSTSPCVLKSASPAEWQSCAIKTTSICDISD
jgi:hypothetical protein